MKKWLVFLMILLIPSIAESQMIGIFGQYYSPSDSVRVYITFHDTLGLDLAEPDSFMVVKYYRGSAEAGDTMHNADTSTNLTKIETGLWEYITRAAMATDSTGQYTLFVKAYKDGRSGGKTASYQVLRGDGLYGLFDVQMFLDAGDDFYRVLYPVGSAPKDSVRHYGIFDTNDDGDKADAADTVLFATTHFYHSVDIRFMDSSKTVYHYGVPAP